MSPLFLINCTRLLPVVTVFYLLVGYVCLSVWLRKEVAFVEQELN